MYHTSAKLTFGGGEKYLGVKKAPGGAKKLQGGAQKAPGAQEAFKKNRKNSGDLFFFFFLIFKETVKILYFVGAPKISAGGRRMVNMVNVTPLLNPRVVSRGSVIGEGVRHRRGGQPPQLGFDSKTFHSQINF